jgi:hypothetical protein
MKRILMILFAAALGWAQQDAGPKQAIIDVKYADVNRLAIMLKGVFGSGIQGDATFHVITVTGNPETVAAVTAAVKRFDVPPPAQPDFELTVYLITGVTLGQASDDLPQDLLSTAKQLHSLFPYKSYKLADTIALRGRVNPPGGPFSRREAQGQLSDLRYDLTYNNVNVALETPRTFHIEGLTLTITGPRQAVKEGLRTTDFTDVVARIATDLDLKEGQKTVVGKSSINPAGDALILVIVPKVAD